jgi:chemotaxis protein methyltransferase CheR
MALEDVRPRMNDEEFRLLRDLVYEASGILVRDEMKFVLEHRLAPRVEALGLSSFAEYHRYLRTDIQRRLELENAVEALTTHETYFFREPHQLTAFTEELLPTLEKTHAASRRLRLWSAGCSSGEEPYTLAMLILDSGRFAGWDVEIYATDISKRVLATARKAEYGPSAMRATPKKYQDRFFEPVGNRIRVKDEVRTMVSFGHLNLVDPGMAVLVPRTDVVFCRNVLIYFDLAARKRALRLIYEKLQEGGYLLLGHAENLIHLSADFELVHLEHDLVYRRPTGRKP